MAACVVGCRPTDAVRTASVPTKPGPIEGDDHGLAAAQVLALAGLGVHVASAGLKVKTRTIGEVEVEFERRLAKMWTRRQLDALRHLARLMVGDEALAGVTDQAFVHAIAQTVLRGMNAFYDFDSGDLVFLDRKDRAPADIEELVLHELVHAYQDQRLEGGLSRMFDGERITLDELRIAQLVTEGHAQLVTHAARLQERGRSLADLDPNDLDAGAQRLTAGDWVAIYDFGTRATLAVHRAQGWAGVESLLLTPPRSSEQLLHPEKLGEDLPTVIDPPSIPGARLLSHTVIGELSIFLALASHGVPDEQAFVAAQGWDGDCLALYEWQGRPLTVWRTLWDRPDDALQFESLLRGVPNRSVSAWFQQSGNTVDIVVGPDAEHLEEVGKIARALPTLAPPPRSDADGSARAEADFQARIEAAVVVEGGLVTFAKGPVRIPLPDGWQLRRIKGMPVLLDAPRDGFADNVTVHIESNRYGSTIEELEASRAKEMAGTPGIDLVDAGRTTVGGMEVSFFELHGVWPGQSFELHQLGVTALHGAKVITVTTTTLASRWPEREATLREILAGVQWPK